VFSTKRRTKDMKPLPKTKSPHGGKSRPPLERMMQIHARLKERRFPNCQKIARELEMSSKTIQRDIDFMRYRLGLPIEYDPLRFGFYYSEPVTSFPNVEVSEGEITALFVAQKALAQYKGTPFEQPLHTAFRKITDGLTDRVSFSWSDLDRVISFHSVGSSSADLETFENISKAVLRSVEINFQYRKLQGRDFELRLLQPYHLACLENQWYLFGHDLERRQLRTFALPRMRNVHLTTTRFRRPADFSINKLLRGSFGAHSGNKRYRITLQFDSFAGRLVGERVWHESQRISNKGDGTAVLELDLNGLEEIQRWILSWGSHVRVLAPKELIETIRETAAAIQKQYQL
jgi:predicted DNA-binding transcriptional regulator YafY